MNWIVAREKLSEQIIKLEIRSSAIAQSYCPGHHVIIQLIKDGQRIPLVVAGISSSKASFYVLIQTKDVLLNRLTNLNVGDVVFSIEGPFCEPIPIENSGTIICAAGGNGILPLLPIAEALKKAGNKVYTVLAACSKEFILLENEFRKISEELLIYTDDGSLGKKGLATEGIQEFLQRVRVNQVISFGPSRMIKYSSILTRRFDVPLIATLYSMTIGGNGIVGIFRVSACERSKYICVDGSDFNAFYSDFDAMIRGMEGFLKENYLGNQNYQRGLNRYSNVSY